MELTESTFELYAIKYYDNPHCYSMDEFNEDLKRFSYLKKIFVRYRQNGDINERLVLNHLVVIFNCFGVNGTHMLFMKLEKYHDILKPFVSYLNYLPITIKYNNKVIYTENVLEDGRIKELLKGI